MNKRILELAEQAGYHINGGKIFIRTTSEDITSCQQKFAELIVRECCSVAIEQKKLAQQPTFNYQDATWDRARIQQSDLIIHKIKQHFGVEE